MTVSRCFVRARKRQQRAKAAWENLNSSILSLAERAVTAEDKTATCTETEALMRAAASSVLAQQEERVKVEDKLSEAEVSIFLAVPKRDVATTYSLRRTPNQYRLTLTAFECAALHFERSGDVNSSRDGDFPSRCRQPS